MNTKIKTGMAWYNEKDYPKLRLLFTDGAEATKFPGFYDEWLANAEEAEQREGARGLEVIRAVIEPAAFAAWCKLRKISPDANARKSCVRRGSLLGGRPPKD
jgi:hypothetical protein